MNLLEKLHLPKIKIPHNLNAASLKINIHSFNWHSDGGKLLTLIIAILILSFLIDQVLSRSIFGKRYRIFVAPGVILHELSHAFFCLLLMAPIKKISLFDKDGGSVEHEKSKVPIIGSVLISFAPFIVGGIAIYFMAGWLGLKNVQVDHLTLTLAGMMTFAKSVFGAVNWLDYRNWIILYLVLSVAVTMTPSWQDLRNTFFSALFLGIIIFLLVRLLPYKINFAIIPLEQLLVLLTTVVLLLILSFILSMIVFAFTIVLKR